MLQRTQAFTSSECKPAQPNSVNQAEGMSSPYAGVLLLVVPLGLTLAILFYRKYRDYQHKVALLKQIETLEMLWQISPEK